MDKGEALRLLSQFITSVPTTVLNGLAEIHRTTEGSHSGGSWIK